MVANQLMDLPFEPYKGEEAFIFVSYAHKDMEVVFNDLSLLHKKGYRIWYDEGIDPGNEWPDEIANALNASQCFLVFISNNSVKSKNVQNEINFAINRQKPFFAIYIENVDLPLGLELRMGNTQAILKWRMKQDYYWYKVEKSIPRECAATLAQPIQPVIPENEIDVSTSRFDKAKTTSENNNTVLENIENIYIEMSEGQGVISAFHRSWQITKSELQAFADNLTDSINFLSVNYGLNYLLRGMYEIENEEITIIQCSRTFKAGGNHNASVIFGKTAYHCLTPRCDITSCNIEHWKDAIKIDFWLKGENIDYSQINPNSINIDYRSLIMGIVNIGICFGFKHYSNYTGPFIMEDNELRGFPYLYFELEK